MAAGEMRPHFLKRNAGEVNLRCDLVQKCPKYGNHLGFTMAEREMMDGNGPRNWRDLFNEISGINYPRNGFARFPSK